MDERTEKEKLNAMGKFCKGEEYAKRYKVFLEKCHQDTRVLESLRCYLPEIQALKIQRDVFRVLSVGSGDGEVDLQVLKIIQEACQKQMYWRVIEPNESSFYKYKTKIENSPPNDDVAFDIKEPKGFQNYMAEPCAERSIFDVVHFVHSIYYTDVEETLTHCYEKELGEHGVIMCILAADEIMFNIKQTVFNIYQPNQSISQVVKKRGWKCQEYKDEYLTDVTEIFDDQSETGNLLLDFLTQTVNFRQTASQQKVKETLDLIGDLSFHKDGKRFCKKIDYYTFIFK